MITYRLSILYNGLNKISSDMKKQINDLLLKMQTGENCIGETANELLILFSVSGCFPTGKEVEQAAESFGNLYSQDPNFANGCEAGWKAGAEWMKQKLNDR